MSSTNTATNQLSQSFKERASEQLIDLSNLFDIGDKIAIFLQRTSVQQQVLLLILTLIFSWFLAGMLHKISQKMLRKFDLLHSDRFPLLQGKYLSPIRIEKVLFACISLIVIILLQNIISDLGLRIGLLSVFQRILRSYFSYNLILVIISICLSEETGKYWHYNLLLPFFLSINTLRILDVITSLSELFATNVMVLFGTVFTVGDIILLTAGLYFWVTMIIALQKLIGEILCYNKQFDKGSTEASLILISYFFLALGVVAIFGSVNFNTTALAAITGGLSVGIGFGLKEVFSNFISGLFLLFEQVIKPGDVIIINNDMVQVKKVSIRATTVLSFINNAEIIIPNQTFFTSAVTSYTKSDHTIRKEIIVGASYESDPNQVIAVLLEVARANPQVLKIPEPTAVCTDFADSSINFALRFYVNSPLIGIGVKSQLLTEIWRAFVANNIEIPFPQTDLHIRSSSIPFTGDDQQSS